MSARTGVFLGTIVLTLLSACAGLSDSGAVDDAVPDQQSLMKKQPIVATGVDRSYTPRSNRRTWVIHKTDLPDVVHMKIGDAFRIVKDGNKFYLKPLSSLRKRWGQQGQIDFQVELTKVGNNDPILCGKVSIPNHSGQSKDHVLRIVQSGPDTSNNNLYVEFEDPDDELLLEQQCAKRDTHLGRAHGEH